MSEPSIPEFIWLICPVCKRTTFAPLGTFCQFDEVDLVEMAPATTTEAHPAHDECDGWKADVLALREHHRGLVKRGLKFCPRCGLRIAPVEAR